MTEEKLNDMYLEVKLIKSDLKNFMKYMEENIITKIEDHEKRLRFLDRYAYLLIGGLGLIMFIADKLFK
jgi:hypothetical protein